MKIEKFAELADLIQMDPAKTYMGGGYKRESMRVHDIEIEGKTIRALCDITNDYSDSKYFHLTHPAAYSCATQLLVSYYAHSRSHGRQAGGFHIFLNDYSTVWKKIIKTPKDIPFVGKEVAAEQIKRTERVRFEVSFGKDHCVEATFNAIFRQPRSKG